MRKLAVSTSSPIFIHNSQKQQLVIFHPFFTDSIITHCCFPFFLDQYYSIFYYSSQIPFLWALLPAFRCSKQLPSSTTSLGGPGPTLPRRSYIKINFKGSEAQKEGLTLSITPAGIQDSLRTKDII